MPYRTQKLTPPVGPSAWHVATLRARRCGRQLAPFLAAMLFGSVLGSAFGATAYCVGRVYEALEAMATPSPEEAARAAKMIAQAVADAQAEMAAMQADREARTQEMSSLIFLDLDGVLNSAEYWGRRTREQRRRDESPGGIRGGVDPCAARRLNYLVENSGAHLVVSSTIRRFHRPAELFAILRGYGVVAEFKGVTPYLGGRERGFEIESWLASYPGDVTSFVIVDDDSDVKAVPALVPHFVKTDCATGLLDEHVAKMLAILGSV